MMGTSVVGHDGTSLTALLEVVSDPEAAKAKLNEFNAKIEEAKGFLAQAKDVNAENARMVREITERTDAAFKIQADKEKELSHRENQLAARHQDVASSHQELLSSKENLQALEQELIQKALTFAQKEQELEAKVTATLASLEKNFTERKASLEQDYATLKANAQKLFDQASKHAAEAVAANVAAQEQKMAIEKRAAALKQAMEG